MPENVLDGPWNFAVTYLQFFYNEQELAVGSGFFWQDINEKLLLISNWHNFSGRNPNTLEPLHSQGGIPNKLRFHLYKKVSGNDKNGNFNMEIFTATIPLSIETTQTNLWYEHPQLGKDVDVAAIDITNLKDDQNLLNGVNTLETDIDRDFYVSQDSFIVGYPLGLVSSFPPIPVWKRGTISTEPNINPDGKQIIYLDSATRPAMSGSIVLTKDIVLGPYQKKDGTTTNTIISNTTQILGIYSGRIGASNLEAQLGIVWKRKLIDEVVNARKIAANILL